MEDLTQTGIIDLAYKYGALPLLIYSVAALWKKIRFMENKIQEVNEAHKTDLRNHTEEVKSLQQNTLNSLNELKNDFSNIKDL